MQRIEQITLPRPIWPDDDLKRSQFYFEVFECLEAVYLDLRNHAWFSAPFLASSLFLGSISQSRYIPALPLLRDQTYLCKAPLWAIQDTSSSVSPHRFLYRSLLLLSFLLFHEVTTYVLLYGIVCRPKSR